MNTEWKPIASAPENEGRPLFCELCWGPEGDQSVGTGFRHNGKWYAAGLFYCLGQEKRYELREVEVQPTHWKPQSDLPDEESAAPTSHPIPNGATGDRDWELACDECNGSGHVFVERQVAERKTDVQEFKEECECCDGRGFNIAFEDIPGIAEYVKSCRPATTVAAGAANDGRQAFAKWFDRRGVWPALCYEEVFIAGWNARPVAAPAAGDEQTAAARDVLAERQRQISAEGWTLARDDAYSDGQMAVAAGYYALASGFPHERDIGHGHLPVHWPWAATWWKPRTPRENLVRAGALILAEIERLDRATIAQQSQRKEA